MTDAVLDHPGNAPPNRFTTAGVGWLPWLQPLEEEALTDRHREGLTEPSRAKSPYFMLLAHDPEVLGARTQADKDIFHNADGGLPRADRELAAAAASRANGCILCASVHARFAAQHSKRTAEVEALLADGVGAPLAGRWGALVRGAAALTATPSTFGAAEVAELDRAGVRPDERADLVLATAFFAWANRLMLSPGEPTPPAP
jgi:alkylhydroperoxidase domain protein